MPDQEWEYETEGATIDSAEDLQEILNRRLPGRWRLHVAVPVDQNVGNHCVLVFERPKKAAPQEQVDRFNFDNRRAYDFSDE